VTQKVIGILGGMGPESTAALYEEIIRRTPIHREQDHLRVIIDSNPKVPDRTRALLAGDTAEVVAALTTTARNLERAGAELIGMPCNTAHAFLADIRAAVRVPVLDMPDETARAARGKLGEDAAIGVLATDGTLRAEIYHRGLARHGLRPVLPGVEGQEAVMAVIGDVKRNGVESADLGVLTPAVDDVVRRGACAVLAGCTEISLALARRHPPVPWLDPLQVLARRLIEEARG
jgi:aspartate racemase